MTTAIAANLRQVTSAHTEVIMKNDNRQQPPSVPLEYAGRWIAWDHDGMRIVATGRTFAEAREAAIKAGEPDPLLGKAPAGMRI